MLPLRRPARPGRRRWGCTAGRAASGRPPPQRGGPRLARWVQWFLTLQQFCSAIVKCLGPLDPAGPAAAATTATTPMGRSTRGPCSGQGHTRDSRRSPRIRSRALRSTRTFPAAPADHGLGLTTLRCREVTRCGGADRWEPLGAGGLAGPRSWHVARLETPLPPFCAPWAPPFWKLCRIPSRDLSVGPAGEGVPLVVGCLVAMRQPGQELVLSPRAC